MTYSLSKPECLHVISPETDIYMGGSQDWYPDEWQRLSGCGPTTASNIMWYVARSHAGLQTLCGTGDNSQQAFLALMLEMFTYVTPGTRGVHTSAHFIRGTTQYGSARSVAITPHVLEIPMLPSSRPDIDAVCSFITAAMQADTPVAFLNLSNGSLEELDSWHWVTILGVDTGTATAQAVDQGKALPIDMACWLRTTRLGGALVYLTMEE